MGRRPADISFSLAVSIRAPMWEILDRLQDPKDGNCAHPGLFIAFLGDGNPASMAVEEAITQVCYWQ